MTGSSPGKFLDRALEELERYLARTPLGPDDFSGLSTRRTGGLIGQLPVDLLRLMGYARGAYALGYVDDLRDPIEVLRPDLASTGFAD